MIKYESIVEKYILCKSMPEFITSDIRVYDTAYIINYGRK